MSKEEETERLFFNFPCTPQEFLSEKTKFLTFIRILSDYLKNHSQVQLEVFQTIIRKQAALQRNEETRVHDITFLLRTYRAVKSDVPTDLWNGAMVYYDQFIKERRTRNTVTVNVVENETEDN